MDFRKSLANKKKIVIKIGTSSITYPNTGDINLDKLERFVRILIDMRNEGKEVIVVSSGAVGVGRKALGLRTKPSDIVMRQACAAVGQARLIMMYEKFFSEYGHITAQVLLTKETIGNEQCAANVTRTFDTLSELGVVPIVNENDAVSVDELRYGQIGDNDTLSAYVAQLVRADLVILLSDIDGLYTDDPRTSSDAKLIPTVTEIDERLESMAKGAGSDLGTGGMATKINAAKKIMSIGADMVIASGDDIGVVNRIMDGEDVGTLFVGKAGGQI